MSRPKKIVSRRAGRVAWEYRFTDPYTGRETTRRFRFSEEREAQRAFLRYLEQREMLKLGIEDVAAWEMLFKERSRRPADARPPRARAGAARSGGRGAVRGSSEIKAWFKKAPFQVTLGRGVLRPSLCGGLMKDGAWTGRARVSSDGTSRSRGARASEAGLRPSGVPRGFCRWARRGRCA